jgi:hypothetical protein
MRKLATIHYEGEECHFGYEKYCRPHVICHADLERTSADGVPMSETDKCMYFINGLRHPMMAQAKAAYHARMPGQLDTFHALEQFCGTFIARMKMTTIAIRTAPIARPPTIQATKIVIARNLTRRRRRRVRRRRNEARPRLSLNSTRMPLTKISSRLSFIRSSKSGKGHSFSSPESCANFAVPPPNFEKFSKTMTDFVPHKPPKPMPHFMTFSCQK